MFWDLCVRCLQPLPELQSARLVLLKRLFLLAQPRFERPESLTQSYYLQVVLII